MNAGRICLFTCVILVLCKTAALSEEKLSPKVYPTALLSFDERGIAARRLGPKVTDLLFASLAKAPSMYLVDRADLNKILEEQALNASGAVSSDQAIRIGQLTGAKYLITGSVVQADQQTYLLAKVIGVGTSRVVGASVSGDSADGLAHLVEKLADHLLQTMSERADELVATAVYRDDHLDSLKKRLARVERKSLPSLAIAVEERHFGQVAITPAVAAELKRFAHELGFEIDAQTRETTKADVVLSVKAETAIGKRVGSFVTATAMLDLDVIDRKSDKVVFTDRQKIVVLEVSEQIAGRLALEEGSALLAERIFPKLVNEP